MMYLQQESPIFPAGTVEFDFDLRSYYPQTDSEIWKATFKLHVEVAKYFLNLRSLDNTIEAMKYVLQKER